jgi:hypothetical protein
VGMVDRHGGWNRQRRLMEVMDGVYSERDQRAEKSWNEMRKSEPRTSTYTPWKTTSL